jgi:hypothetical protein
MKNRIKFDSFIHVVKKMPPKVKEFFYGVIGLIFMGIFIEVNFWLYELKIEWIRGAQFFFEWLPLIILCFIAPPIFWIYRFREKIWNFILFLYGIACIVAGIGWVIFGIEYLISFIQRFFPAFLHW